MKRGKRRGKYPVSDAAILREIRKAKKKLRSLRRKASETKQQGIALELKVLSACEALLEDILCF